ncbi:MAG: aminopeptidase, partial [Cyclobacteriaceae bacterium]|nr:aminopeptidase [Cyclobacteriaceae bacterium]
MEKYTVKTLVKTSFHLLLLLLLIWIVANLPLVYYGIKQGYGQLSIIWKAQPIDEFLQQENLPDSTKNKIHLIREAKNFAIESLQLNNSENYTTIFDQEGKDLMF